ncbi:hypothetical protein EJ05DRAFT_479834 [Pseudovirgaria hyperparasitica]|uniref:Uncharacterized protein n=1 Tax=Pseudovirgaria hyperparasitica TaxID=470096 RepID=A0A6A6VYE5_9PEZI|nr:uncharacterized protein EJ05DRAFT_479834 [Pseudovirgaria hyperparasitica]KAF2754317.1 hypothetical protein EJ05DRAFT_479834 [Pseudovirgaria hyperparasitica]
MPTDPLVSTGRGGAGNIGKSDGTEYADGSIVRENISDTITEPHSGGRGGFGNIHTPTKGTPKLGATQRDDAEIVPETALKHGEYENYHTGRGGEGNVHKEKYGGHSQAQKEHKTTEEGKSSIADKVKHALHLDKDKKSGA